MSLERGFRLMRVLIAVANADGELAEQEVAMFEENIDSIAFDESQRIQLRAELHSPMQLEDVCGVVETEHEKEALMTLALQMALADGKYQTQEQAIIARLGELLYPPNPPNTELAITQEPQAHHDKSISVSSVNSNVKVVFENGRLPGPSLFGIESHPGELRVKINSNHPASSLFVHSVARDGLKYLLLSWATMEETSGEKSRQLMEDMRHDWGRVLRDVVQQLEDEESNNGG